MKKYKVLLQGENFEIMVENKNQNCGFYTTRIVKASSEKEAEEIAINLIKNDNSLIEMTIKASQYTPRIFLEDIEYAPWWKRVGGRGYTFFPMEEE